MEQSSFNLAGHRIWQTRHPVLQSTSRQNHRVEHMWPEISEIVVGRNRRK